MRSILVTEDPRYLLSDGGGFWRRTGHAFRGTILTHTDRGTETLSIWRLGSGLDFASNLASEFWPDLRRKILRRRP
jgi:hypothetical protein